MLKAIRKHLKASKKNNNFMQYMKINRKDDQLDNNWIQISYLDDLTNDLVDNSLVYRKDCIDLIPYKSNNINNYYQSYNNYYNYNNEREVKKDYKKREESHSKRSTNETKIQEISDLEAIQLNRQHLHALHRFRRHKKRGIASDKDVVISFSPKTRLSIVNKREFYYRFGKEEKEAIACFDFLNDICCDISDDNDSNEFNDCHSNDGQYMDNFDTSSELSVVSKEVPEETVSLGRSYSQLSLSDSCVEYYDSSD
ncbi:uncharacterized protein LOC128965429 [Oppia nitens]|uniref:uncharacterized protein LOC128965429 n=1 Tax=Oppia nitens TaxID=1686743 RepID=UPI0023DB36AF|nr:uncharacterized protein LOC128965429 [Oppia nitens]